MGPGWKAATVVLAPIWIPLGLVFGSGNLFGTDARTDTARETKRQAVYRDCVSRLAPEPPTQEAK